jgi:hypothetical protein
MGWEGQAGSCLYSDYKQGSLNNFSRPGPGVMRASGLWPGVWDGWGEWALDGWFGETHSQERRLTLSRDCLTVGRAVCQHHHSQQNARLIHLHA